MKSKNAHISISSGFQKAQAQYQVTVQRELTNLLKILHTAPDAYLILSPDLKIEMVTDAYLAARLCRREDLVGKYIFDVFPVNSAVPAENLNSNLQASFDKVLGTKKADQMLLQHYLVPRPKYIGGGFEEKHWIPSNTPVLNDAGEVTYIIHKITDVTDLLQSQQKHKQVPLKHNALKGKLYQFHRIHQKLEEEQRRLEETQTLGHIGSFEAKFPYKNIRWSNELFRIHGLEPQSENIVYEKYTSFVHPDDKEMFAKILELFLKEQKELNHIYRIRRRDKAVRVLHLIARVAHTLSGKAHKVHGTVQDITEQVEAEQELREKENLLRQAEVIGQVGSYSCEIATMQLQFSEGMFRLLGYEPKAFSPTLDFIDSVSHPDDVPVVRQILEQAAQTKQPYEYFRRIFRPNGKMFYMHSRGRVECDSGGNAKKFIGIVHDITERTLSEEKLRQSELLYRTLVSNTPDVITRWDKNLELVFSNQVLEASAVVPASSLYLQNVPEEEKLEDAPLSWKKKISAVLMSGLPQDHHHSYDLPLGKAHYHSRLVPEFAADDTIKSVLVIARDITALKRLEEENLKLRLTQQKELLLAIMDTQETERKRIAEALHNGIGQLLYGAKLNLDQLTRKDLAPDFHTIKASVLKTDQMLEEAINQVRNISHELTPHILEQFGLEVAFKQICASFKTDKLDFQCVILNLRQDLESHLQISVYRIAQELANNIIKHAQATEASLLLREKKDSLVLLAEDNGIGFDPQQIEKKGIGIKSIQDRVKLLNGTMRIHSAPGQGTLIQVILPLTP